MMGVDCIHVMNVRQLQTLALTKVCAKEITTNCPLHECLGNDCPFRKTKRDE